MQNMKRVLFIDVQNATRSQIAEALFNYFADGTAEARSCGTMPAPRVSRRAIEVMAELNIDISRKFPRAVSQLILARADVIVLIGKGIYPRAFAPTLTWDIEDATGKSLEQVRELRNQLSRRVLTLLDEINQPAASALAPQLQPQMLNEFAWSI